MTQKNNVEWSVQEARLFFIRLAVKNDLTCRFLSFWASYRDNYDDEISMWLTIPRSFLDSWTSASVCFPRSSQTPPFVTLILFFCFCHWSTCPVKNTRCLFSFSLHLTTGKCRSVVVVYPHGFKLSFSCLTLWWNMCGTASKRLTLWQLSHRVSKDKFTPSF